MEKPIVFLSHSSADKEQLTSLKNLLDRRAAGCLDFFLSSDGQSIRFGRNWVTRIGDALSKTRLMFVFISQNSLNSNWIHFEAGCAYAKDVQVVPVCLPGMDLNRVIPPLSLLQGFNLHHADALSNVARICNEAFQLRIEERFSHEEFEAVFAEFRRGERSFFGDYTWTVGKIEWESRMELHAHDALEPLRQVCRSLGQEFLDIPPRPDHSSHGFELPGMCLSASEIYKGSGAGRQFSHTAMTCILSPELFHANSSLLDQWFVDIPELKPKTLVIELDKEIGFESARQRLTTKLYQSGIRWVDQFRFDFKGLHFRLYRHGCCRLGVHCGEQLHDPRIPLLICSLFNLGVLFQVQLEIDTLS